MIDVILILLAVTLVFILGPALFGAPWIPTRETTIRKMLSMAGIKEGDVVYDLGAGDGRIVIAAAKDFKAHSVGIEINPFLVFWARLRTRSMKLDVQAKIVWGNFYREDLSKADVVTLYLWQGTNDALRDKLKRELRTGSRVVSRIFTFSGWKPSVVDEKRSIYVYQM
jgi:SAM-dependent methyltransferase